jgi:hypothetical protein
MAQKTLVNWAPDRNYCVLTHYGRVAVIFFNFILTTIGPAHHTYNIQLTKK